MKKHLKSLLLVMLVAILMAGCNSTSDTGGEGEETAEAPKTDADFYGNPNWQECIDSLSNTMRYKDDLYVYDGSSLHKMGVKDFEEKEKIELEEGMDPLFIYKDNIYSYDSSSEGESKFTKQALDG